MADNSEKSTDHPERRNADRQDDVGWEEKVLRRVGGRMRKLEDTDASELGWEAAVLEKLRRRIEQKPE